MQNQKKPIQQKKPMQNFTAEKWADKIALFIDNFGFLSGFFWHWTIALPSPTSHLAMLHSKIILSDPNRRVKVVCIGFSLFWSRCRTWGSKKRPKKIPDTGSAKFSWGGACYWWLRGCTVASAAFWKSLFWDTLYYPNMNIETSNSIRCMYLYVEVSSGIEGWMVLMLNLNQGLGLEYQLDLNCRSLFG